MPIEAKHTRQSNATLLLLLVAVAFSMSSKVGAVPIVVNYTLDTPTFSSPTFDALNTALAPYTQISGSVMYDTDDLTGSMSEVLTPPDVTLTANIDSAFDSTPFNAYFSGGVFVLTDNWSIEPSSDLFHLLRLSFSGSTISATARCDDSSGANRCNGDRGNFETVTGQNATITVTTQVPEAPTISLLALGLAALSLSRRRTARRKPAGSTAM